ncbi:Major facilitator superfamily domain general substrate transporter [Penicillium sp. IBT 18751x]|nr:Major facilitator superfamily domain general substrate transporter [Penicillium sp. IBT 18751x]
MRRIDLFCKLLGPLFISFVESYSTRVAIWTIFGLNTVSVLIEYLAIAQVYRSVPALKRATPALSGDGTDEATSDYSQQRQSIVNYIRKASESWLEYIASPVFLASFALSLLYLTVLSFGATMVTYLLESGFSSLEVSFMRIGSVAAELSGTWTAPLIMNKIGPIRSGLWFLNWQLCCVAGATAAFVIWDSSFKLVAGSLVVGVALSRIGLWGFDLSVQFLVQEVSHSFLRVSKPRLTCVLQNVPEHARARFSATEMALQNIFEMLSFASTIVFHLPSQFQYPVVISNGAVALAAICFAAYVRKERGHLLHRSKCLGGDKMVYRRVESAA